MYCASSLWTRIANNVEGQKKNVINNYKMCAPVIKAAIDLPNFCPIASEQTRPHTLYNHTQYGEHFLES